MKRKKILSFIMVIVMVMTTSMSMGAVAYAISILNDQDAPTGLAGVAPTSALNDGKITGTTTAMEYKLATAADSTYAVCSAENTTVATAGDYVVRLAAKTGYNAGATAAVTVPAYVAPSDPNVALNKSTTSSSNINASWGSARAVDGYITAGNSTGWAFADGDTDRWITIDLGQTYNISGWKLVSGVGSWSYNNATAFRLQKSEDGVTYTDVDTGTATQHLDSEVYTKAVSCTTRYIRVVIDEIYAGGIQTAKIKEIEVYGTAVVEPNVDQDAPTGLAGVAPTSALNDGKITGTTTAMEYRLATAADSTYAACSAENTIVATAGDYVVRLAAKTGFNAGATAAVTVAAYIAPTSKSGSNSTHKTRQSADTEKIAVLVNGKEERAGTETKESVKGVTEAKLNVDTALLSKIIEDVIKNKADSSQNLIEISVSDSNNSTVALTGDIVKKMETDSFDISIKKDKVSYIIPTSEITIDKVAGSLRVNSNDLKDIEIDVKINKVSDEILAKYNEIAKKFGNELVVAPIEFQIIAKTTGTDDKVRETSVSKFSNYVERIMEIPADVDPSKITTGIVFNADGTYSHVPTDIFQKDGKWYARLNSLTNSTYSVICNSTTVESVKGHWSEVAVNDMASRLVLIDYKNFEADKAVTRAEFADYIVRGLGLYREGETLKNTFKDVAEGSKNQVSIQIASDWGIINGYTDGTFRGENTITREEAMSMYANAMDIAKIVENKANELSTFTDNAQVSKWAAPSTMRVVNADIFNGKDKGVLDPKGTLTQAEALTAVRNLLLKADLINK